MKNSHLLLGGAALAVAYIVYQRSRVVQPSGVLPETVTGGISAEPSRAQQIAGGLGGFFNGFAGLYDAFNPKPDEDKAKDMSTSAVASHLDFYVPKLSGYSPHASNLARNYSKASDRIMTRATGPVGILPSAEIMIGLR